MIRTRFSYTLLLYALLPGVLWHLLWRARRQPAYLKNIPERFGYYRQQAMRPLIWVHAVSVGESRAAAPLVRALQEKYPEHQILLTHMTPTGSEAGEALFGDSVLRCYLPYDYPGAVTRFLEHFKPRAGLLMETEIWPNLINGCRRGNIPLYLVNARLSEKSFSKYRRFAELARASLRELAGIAAQTRDDAERFAELGAENVAVTGNLKFDIEPPAGQLALGKDWRKGYGAGRPVLLAASTRDGEEEALLGALERIAAPSLLTVIVPRHPQRFGEVAALLERRGIRFQRRSGNAAIAPETRVVLGDSMGEMFAYYAACDVAFVGGSLLPFGGQNLIEACAVARPVLVGPHTYNFAEATELAIAAGAAVRVGDARELVREAQRLLEDGNAAARMAEAARAFSRAHRGATRRVMELLRF
ncbi:MAG: lipid IV(A) 3-deoxy-D-manno-octulosonic acid transferase [Burkholderiales bacterium]|nr:lipid IV(A) 3-deoxy-D-manno-octulosonic acid transferase [Burkholderiales bacterium]